MKRAPGRLGRPGVFYAVKGLSESFFEDVPTPPAVWRSDRETPHSWKDPIPGRKNDSLGFGVAHAVFGCQAGSGFSLKIR